MEAFEIGNFVVIGLSSDKLVSKLSKPHITDSFEERKQGLKAWLEIFCLLRRAKILPLHDTYGSSVKDPEIEALVVSEETKPTALKINDRREKAGLPKLEIVTVRMVPSENCGPISTTRIRRGEMDREGRLIKNIKH